MYLVCVFPSCLNQTCGGRVALGLLLVTVSVFLDFSPPPFQQQSWIEKRGGTGCGLLAEGELNSHSLSLSLTLPPCTFSFFQWRLKSIHSVDCWHSPAQRAQDLWLPLMGMLWTKALPSAQSCQPPIRPAPSLHLPFKDAGIPPLPSSAPPPPPPPLSPCSHRPDAGGKEALRARSGSNKFITRRKQQHLHFVTLGC